MVDIETRRHSGASASRGWTCWCRWEEKIRRCLRGSACCGGGRRGRGESAVVGAERAELADESCNVGRERTEGGHGG